MPIATSTYHTRLAVRADPALASPRCQRDIELKPKIKRVWDDNYQVYGVRKAWRQLRREGVDVAGCTVARRTSRITIFELTVIADLPCAEQKTHVFALAVAVVGNPALNHP